MKNSKICYFKGYLLLNLQIMVSIRGNCLTEQNQDKNTKQNSSKFDLHKIHMVKLLTVIYIALSFGKIYKQIF